MVRRTSKLGKKTELKWQARGVNFSPVKEGVVEVFTEALQNPVMIPDGGSFILTGRKVTLQLRETEPIQSHSEK